MAARSPDIFHDIGLQKGIRVRLSVFATRLFSFLAYYTPVWFGYLMADIVAIWLYLRFAGYRDAVIENLRHVYRGRISERELRRRARWVFRTSSRNFWDLACVPRLDRDRLRTMHRVAEGAWDDLDTVLNRGKGAILISAHLGSFDFMGQYIITSRYRPLALTAPTVRQYLFAGVTYLRASLGGRIEVLTSHSIRSVIRALRSGEPVIMVADRNFSVGGSEVEFFGCKTLLPTGPVKLARETGAPLIPIFTFRTDIRSRKRDFYFCIGEPVYIERTTNREADIAHGMGKMVAMLEHYISKAPEQWVMFQPVWGKKGVRSRE